MDEDNGFTINISKDCQNKYDFEKLKDDVLSKIQKDYENSQDKSEQAFLYYLLNIKVHSLDDLDRIAYAYNGGNLRSYEELETYDKQHSHKFMYKNYNVIRHFVNFFCIVTPFGLMLRKTISMKNILFYPIGLLIALILAYIGSLMGNTININYAEQCGLADTDCRVAEEKFKRRTGIYAGVFSAFSIFRHTKKSVKDIANPESWKEMK